MIEGYYEARGLDTDGLLSAGQTDDCTSDARATLVLRGSLGRRSMRRRYEAIVAISTPAPTEVKTVSLTHRRPGDRPCPRARRSAAAAKEAGIEIPVLCHDERYDPVGVCRMCVVDVGARVYAAACVRPCEDGMEVKTATPEVDRNRAQLTELLMVDQPPVEEDPKETTTADNELLVLARRYGLEQEAAELARGSGRGEDYSNPVIAVNHDAASCATAACAPATTSRATTSSAARGKGYSTRIAFDLNDPMGESSCVTCGECVAACPTGALTTSRSTGCRSGRGGAAAGRHGLPVLRRRLRADLPRRRRAQRDRVRRRPRAARLAEAAVRQGPLRLGLRRIASSASTTPLIRRE